jgi:sulfatase maturation enzyme AslB (radical SAM superfamily)
MSEATLEAYISQLLESHRARRVTVAWQGGEPTLMNLDFFRRSVELVEKYRRPGQVVEHTFQTNGILLDDDWCTFFKEHNLLVGLSVDGPREIHDAYRFDRRGQGTFDRVMQGWRHLCRHGVEFNIRCTVNAANEKQGRTFARRRGGPQLPLCGPGAVLHPHAPGDASVTERERRPVSIREAVARPDPTRSCGSGLKFKKYHKK